MVVYKITNKLNGKTYVGQTSRPIEKRFLQHSKSDSPLGQAMRQCGLENFTIEIIEECATPEQTKTRERFWIGTLKCKVPNGYNQSDGGESCTPKTRRVLPKFTPNSSTGAMKIKEALIRVRTAQGMTIRQFAEKTGIPYPNYRAYETDGTMPPALAIIKIAQSLNVTTDYVLGLSDTPQPMQFDEQEVREAFELRDSLAKVFFRLKNVEQQN